jgi:sortase (surface protein transpeptidase)
MAPGASSGSILFAGHVDSASAGRGALFALEEASGGDLIQIGTAAGRTYTYRIVSIRRYPKAALPLQVYSRTGRTQLVLVTCGGPFDAVTGHYRDNIVVVAVPTS